MTAPRTTMRQALRQSRTLSHRTIHNTRMLATPQPQDKATSDSSNANVDPKQTMKQQKTSSDDTHPAKQPDPQTAPESSTGFGAQEEVSRDDPTSQKNLPSDKD